MYLVIHFLVFKIFFLLLSIILLNFNRCLLCMMKEEGINVSYEYNYFYVDDLSKETVSDHEGSDILPSHKSFFHKLPPN